MRFVGLFLCAILAGGGAIGCGGSDDGVVTQSDASMDTGGANDSGGSKATGGTSDTGGSTKTGGTTGSGGNSKTGGTTGSGGSTKTGGTTNTGGTDVITCGDITCTSPATCDDSGSTPVCICPDGYTDDNGDGSQCTDIDECADSALNDCHLRATCENTDGSFTCTCDAPAYDGNGTTCSCASGYVVAADDATVCVAEDGGPCGDDLDCSSGFCVGGTCCSGPCNLPPTCRTTDGATCADGSTCAYPVAPDGTDCEDGDACTSTTCTSGVCGSPVDISGSCPSSDCKVGSCDSVEGCKVTNAPGTTNCDDSNPCTVGTTCQPDGTCGGGTPYNCDDAKPCTDDSCVDNNGTPLCVNTNNSDYCGGAGCPTKDMCVNGSCQADAGTACSGCSYDPCGEGAGWADSCTDGTGGDYTCNCATGFTEVNGTCVCDIEGNFAVEVTAYMKYDGDSNNVLHSFDDVLIHSWILRTHTRSGNDILVTEQPCGAETPEICINSANPLLGLAGLNNDESYRGNVPYASWDAAGMPVFNGSTFSIDIAVPGNAFATSNEAMVNGLVLNGDATDPANWPSSNSQVIAWTNPDGDGYDGVQTIWDSGSASTVCPRGGTPSFTLTLPPTGIGGTKAKYVDGASRVIKSYDGQFDDCDTLSGTVGGPSDNSNGYQDQYVASARVRDCRHANGSDCTNNEANFLDGNVEDNPPYIKSASFVMKRLNTGSPTCVDVRAAF